MSDHETRDNGRLVSAGRRELATLTAANPLVLRGFADLTHSRVLNLSTAVHSDAELVWSNLMKACGGQSVDELINWCNKAIRLDLNLKITFNIRGNAWRKTQEFEKAIMDFDEAIRVDPHFAISYTNRGRTWLEKREFGKAVKDFECAIHVEPENADICREVAWLFATSPVDELRDGTRAIQLATIACNINRWEYGDDLAILAAAYAEVGRFKTAVCYQELALEYDECVGPDGNEFRQRLELYKQQQPFRDCT